MILPTAFSSWRRPFFLHVAWDEIACYFINPGRKSAIRGNGIRRNVPMIRARSRGSTPLNITWRGTFFAIPLTTYTLMPTGGV